MTNVGLDEGDDSDEEPKKAEYVPLNPFKDLYPHSDIVKAMKEFG